MNVVGYTYKADTYCEDCVEKEVRQDRVYSFAHNVEALSLSEIAKLLDIDPDDEYSYDSDDWPKNILESDESGDTPETCCKCHELIENQWTGEAMDTVVEWAREYLVEGTGDVAFIEKCIDYVYSWDDEGATIVDLFEDKLKYERNKQHEGRQIR